MSRSYKHHNICANTCCGYDSSEKKDKQRANRKHRSKCKQILKDQVNGEDFSEVSDLPLLKEVENNYTWIKDGKHLIEDWKNCPDKSLHFTKDGKLKR